MHAGGQGQQINFGLGRIVADLPELAIADEQRPVVAVHAPRRLRHLHGHLLRDLDLPQERDGHTGKLRAALDRLVKSLPNELAGKQLAVLVMKRDARWLPLDGCGADQPGRGFRRLLFGLSALLSERIQQLGTGVGLSLGCLLVDLLDLSQVRHHRLADCIIAGKRLVKLLEDLQNGSVFLRPRGELAQ